MNSLADLYKDPFANRETALQPAPDIPVEEGMSPAEMAGWGAVALGSGLIGRAAYKKGAELLKPVKDFGTGVSELGPVRKVKKGVQESLGKAGDTLSDITLDGSIASARYLRALAEESPMIAKKHFSGLNFRQHPNRAAVAFTPDELSSVLSTLAKEAADPVTRKFMAENYDRLSPTDLDLIKSFVGTLKKPIGAAENAYFMRGLNHMKAAKQLDNNKNLFANEADVGNVLSRFNTVFNKYG